MLSLFMALKQKPPKSDSQEHRQIDDKLSWYRSLLCAALQYESENHPFIRVVHMQAKNHLYYLTAGHQLSEGTTLSDTIGDIDWILSGNWNKKPRIGFPPVYLTKETP